VTGTSRSDPHPRKQGDDIHDDIIYPSAIPFVLVHLVAVAALATGVTVEALVICAILYATRMFAVTAGYHRYFAHRSFKTSRLGQYALAWLAQSSAQRGILWWAAKHRHHHKYSDTRVDVHSPRHHGFWYAHLGWIFTTHQSGTDYKAVPDLAKYPELVRLNKHPYLPATVLGVACWLIAGWPGLVVGFFWSTVLLYHGTFFINSLAHLHGTQRYVTGDDSRNNWWLALVTLGEGWHNNHHAYMASTRQGFRWWEVDITYYVLKTLSWARVVRDLNEPPKELVRNERKLARGVVERVARQLAASLSVDRISTRVRDALEHTPRWDEMRQRARIARSDAMTMLAEMHLPHIPTIDELRVQAARMFAATPSLEEVVTRARELLIEAIAMELGLVASPDTA
jgi:stearoyl-CoA desaturase (delta-9 desaturase)